MRWHPDGEENLRLNGVEQVQQMGRQISKYGICPVLLVGFPTRNHDGSDDAIIWVPEIVAKEEIIAMLQMAILRLSEPGSATPAQNAGG